MREEEDEKDFKEWIRNSDYHDLVKDDWLFVWQESRRILREKIKADPTIGKLEVDEWPESPDY